MGVTSSWKVSANKFIFALDRIRGKQMPIEGVIRAPEQACGSLVIVAQSGIPRRQLCTGENPHFQSVTSCLSAMHPGWRRLQTLQLHQRSCRLVSLFRRGRSHAGYIPDNRISPTPAVALSA